MNDTWGTYSLTLAVVYGRGIYMDVKEVRRLADGNCICVLA